MQFQLKSLVVLAITVLILDFIFISLMIEVFKKQIYKVQNSPLQMNIYSTVLCYLFMIAGLYYFIICCKRPVKDAFFLGLLVYGVYELTTMSLLKDWNLSTVLLDTVWGGVLFASSTFITYQFV